MRAGIPDPMDGLAAGRMLPTTSIGGSVRAVSRLVVSGVAAGAPGCCAARGPAITATATNQTERDTPLAGIGGALPVGGGGGGGIAISAAAAGSKLSRVGVRTALPGAPGPEV